MTRVSHQSTNRQAAGQTRPPGLPMHADSAYARKLKTIERLAMEILARVENRLQESPEAILTKQSTMLPTELDDNKQYFLKKIGRVRETLRELSNLVPLDSQTPDLRGEVGVELMVLFVLIESFRPERIAESGCSLDEGARTQIRERIESLGLDVINMRERLK